MLKMTPVVNSMRYVCSPSLATVDITGQTIKSPHNLPSYNKVRTIFGLWM